MLGQQILAYPEVEAGTCAAPHAQDIWRTRQKSAHANCYLCEADCAHVNGNICESAM